MENNTLKSSFNTTLSVEITTSSEKRHQMERELYEGLLTGIAYFSFVAGIPGIIANILIIITYTKIGITTSINTSYTAMAISDIGCILTTIGFEYFTIPHIERTAFIPVDAIDWIPMIGYPNLAFTKVTSCITAYISVERCLCVASPHKVKLLFTKKLTILVLTMIFIVCTLPVLLLPIRYKFEWKASDTFPNKTVMGFTLQWNPTAMRVFGFVQFMYGIFLHWLPIAVTLVGSIFLIVHLNAGSKWRSKNIESSNTSKKEDAKGHSNNKEDRIVKAVLAIATISIVLSTPLSINFVLNLIDIRNLPFVSEDFSLMNDIRASLFTTILMLNSCFNIIIYYKLGSKFRSTLRELLRSRGDKSDIK